MPWRSLTLRMPTSRTPADGFVQGVASSAAAAPSGGKRKRTPSGYEFGSGMRAATGVLGCGHGGSERDRGRIAGKILRRSSQGHVDGDGDDGQGGIGLHNVEDEAAGYGGRSDDDDDDDDEGADAERGDRLAPLAQRTYTIEARPRTEEEEVHDDEQVGDIIGDPHELDDWVPQLAAAPRAASPPLYLESRADTANSSEADAAGAEPQEMGKFGRARPRKKT